MEEQEEMETLCAAEKIFYQEKAGDRVWWVENDLIGVYEFSFDRKKVYNLFADYPHALTPEERAIFDEENLDCAIFFRGRG